MVGGTRQRRIGGDVPYRDDPVRAKMLMTKGNIIFCRQCCRQRLIICVGTGTLPGSASSTRILDKRRDWTIAIV